MGKWIKTRPRGSNSGEVVTPVHRRRVITSNIRNTNSARINNSNRPHSIMEIAYDNDNPEAELSGSWTPRWRFRTRTSSSVRTFHQDHRWVMVSSRPISDIEDEDEEEETPNSWYIQRAIINIDPGSYDFWCRLHALIDDRGYFQTEE